MDNTNTTNLLCILTKHQSVKSKYCRVRWDVTWQLQDKCLDRGQGTSIYIKYAANYIQSYSNLIKYNLQYENSGDDNFQDIKKCTSLFIYLTSLI